MSGISKFTAGSKEIILVDFEGLGEEGMMAQFTALKHKVIAENKKQLIIARYTPKNFGTPRYMKHIRKEYQEMIGLVDKIATVGLSPTQKLLLKGLSFFFRRNYKVFDTIDQAAQYLTDESTTDNDIPEYMKDL